MIGLNGRVHFKHRGGEKILGLRQVVGRLPQWSNFVETKLPKTFSALCLWKSNLNEIIGDHANENYEVNMWGKYCRIYSEFAHTHKKNSALFKVLYNQYTNIDCLITQTKWKAYFIKLSLQHQVSIANLK
jgi:hypothetical protein